MPLKIEVVRVLKGCQAYKEGENYYYEKGKIVSDKSKESSCISAETTIHTNIGRIQFQHPLYLSCLDAGITAEGCGNVIFKISKEEK